MYLIVEFILEHGSSFGYKNEISFSEYKQKEQQDRMKEYLPRSSACLIS